MDYFDGNTGVFENRYHAIALLDAQRRMEYVLGIRPLFPNFGTDEWQFITVLNTGDISGLRHQIVRSLSDSSFYKVINVSIENLIDRLIVEVQLLLPEGTTLLTRKLECGFQSRIWWIALLFSAAKY